MTTLPLIGHLHGVAHHGSFGIHYHMRRSVIFSIFSSLSILVNLVPPISNNKSIVTRNRIQWITCYTRPHFLREMHLHGICKADGLVQTTPLVQVRQGRLMTTLIISQHVKDHHKPQDVERYDRQITTLLRTSGVVAISDVIVLSIIIIYKIVIPWCRDVHY